MATQYRAVLVNTMAVARNSAYIFGSAAISVGVLALFSPTQAADTFGVPLHNVQSTDSTTYLAAKGVRDITLGICYFTFGYRLDTRALRTLMIAHIITGLVDSVLVWKNGVSGKAWGHGIGTLGLVLMLGTGFI